ncbi:transmembrane NLP/P60 family protein [Clostridium scatologenes]|uniref:Transmembrane NLP/P60 family protein n=1 Tax=Clostridium scatologenes TaxID=1548 RepID=A0A0E3GSE3_CLOSL|nr:transmembrane NLP/P60 family protein [Clostridium scatologenes]
MKILKKIQIFLFLAAMIVFSGASFNKVQAATGDDIVNYAEKFIGTPYVWGGTSPSGFDCSGFTYYVYGHFGIDLKRTASEQQGQGTYVSRSDLQPGDLVFFGSPAHHVGIYVGNGNMIHAPQTGDVVKISSLHSDFSGGRRLVESYSYEYICSIQHDLQRVHCLSLGQSYVTGKIDSQTQSAIYQFRSIVGLPSGSNVDSSVVDALNNITHKPTIGRGWSSNPVATRYFQWWIGSPRTGVFDAQTEQAAKAWQVKAGIWSAQGADGVIREKDWTAILAKL